jgi:hypothetical protein
MVLSYLCKYEKEEVTHNGAVMHHYQVLAFKTQPWLV